MSAGVCGVKRGQFPCVTCLRFHCLASKAKGIQKASQRMRWGGVAASVVACGMFMICLKCEHVCPTVAMPTCGTVARATCLAVVMTPHIAL